MNLWASTKRICPISDIAAAWWGTFEKSLAFDHETFVFQGYMICFDVHVICFDHSLSLGKHQHSPSLNKFHCDREFLCLTNLEFPLVRLKPKFTVFKRISLFIAAALSFQLVFHHACTASFLYPIDFWPKRRVNPSRKRPLFCSPCVVLYTPFSSNPSPQVELLSLPFSPFRLFALILHLSSPRLSIQPSPQ